MTSSPVQSRLTAIWSQILDVPHIGVDDDFFHLGGDSIRATQLCVRIKKEFNLDSTVVLVFEAPTVRSLSVRLEQLLQNTPEIQVAAPHSRSAAPLPTPSLPAVNRHRALPLSLFFFSADGASQAPDKYKLLLDAARFADTHGFDAIWTPERHFSPFGGLYPNPAVTSAAIAAITTRIRIRAGSIVLPLQDPLRVAEEWAVVDNLSHGRVDIAFASGWNATDFALAPENYRDRRAVMRERIDKVRRLWRGGSIPRYSGADQEIQVHTYPRPIQPDLPIWLACHSRETFELAGQIGANVVTNVWKEELDAIQPHIRSYRDARAQAGLNPRTGVVTLMLHTHVVAPEKNDAAIAAFAEYLSSNLNLRLDAADLPQTMSQANRDAIIRRATAAIIQTRSLVGSPDHVQRILDSVSAADVDEVAALIDFGLPHFEVMDSLERLARFVSTAQASK